MSVESIASSLYGGTPGTTLYHYTSLDALVSIVPTKTLWATDIHYLNDSSELRHAVQLFVREVDILREAAASSADGDLLSQLSDWLRGRLANGNLLFVGCFTEDGDLLSQWRGYTPHARGVSIGFSPMHVLACARAESYGIGRCIYDRSEKASVARDTVQSLLAFARHKGPSTNAHPTQSFHPVFAEAEPDLLRIAALLKHDAFVAEREWRVVSASVSDYVNSPVLHRPGRTTLVPYCAFGLAVPGVEGIGIERAVLGPTPHPDLGANALSQFLSHHRVSGGRPLSTGPSHVPFRET